MSNTVEATTIPEATRRAAREFGDAEALVDTTARLSFVDVADEMTRVASALIGSGVEPGDRVAMWAPNGVRWALTSLGVYSAGAVLVPLNTRYKASEAAHVLRTSGARTLFVVPDFLGADYLEMVESLRDIETLEEVVVLDGTPRGDVTSWDDFLARAESIDPARVHERESRIAPEDMSDIIFTSGTTGAPKGAMLVHGASVRTYVQWSDRVGLRQGDRYLIVYPFFHTAGLKSGLLACLLQGATAIPEPVFDVEVVMRRVAEEKISMLPGPPTVFLTILNHPDLDSYDFSSLRLSATGAAVVPVEVVRRMRDELKFDIVITAYGLTETHGTVTACRHDDPPDVVAETVGTPLDGLEVKLVDDDGAEVPVGEPGEILVRGFNVMAGYFNDEEATRATIDAEGWMKTGDVGILDDAGRVKITDRKKDMFIVGGFNAYPAEIEALMLEHPAIAQVAVIGVPDERLGEVGVAYVILKEGATADAEELRSWCRETMANFKVPREVRIVDQLPLNPSGKVMKFVLRDEHDA